MKWLPFLLVSLFASTGCISLDEKSRGIRDAQKRLEKGEIVYAMKSATYSFSDDAPKYWQVLREEHGLSHEIMLGESDEYVEGFKSIMKPEIDKRYDKEFFDRVWEQAKREDEDDIR